MGKGLIIAIVVVVILAAAAYVYLYGLPSGISIPTSVTEVADTAATAAESIVADTGEETAAAEAETAATETADEIAAADELEVPGVNE